MSSAIDGTIKKCKNCGGDVKFSPSLQGLYCNQCKTATQIDVKPCEEKHIYKDNYYKNKIRKIEAYLKCDSCGANVKIPVGSHSSKCPFCGSNVVASYDGLNYIKPDSIIPFKLDKLEAKDKFSECIKHKWFMPNEFKRKPNIDRIKGIYFPVFTFDEDTFSSYQGRIYTEYTSRDSDGHTSTSRSYRYIDGDINLSHQNVLVESSSSLSQFQLEEIQPYDFTKACKYNDDFVRGYSLEYYNKPLNDCEKTANEIIDRSIRYSILKNYHYDGVSYLNVDTKRQNEKFSYVVLPTYQINYKYRNKDYLNVMNGQNGRVGGSFPRSPIKITFFVISIILVIIAITLGIIYISN